MGILLAAALLYWLLVITEGVYLGRRIVVWMYDRFAPRYEATKDFDVELERHYLAYPVISQLGDVPRPRVLDVAAGTGRFSRALYSLPFFDGTVTNLDAAARMVRAGREATGLVDGVTWVHALAYPLPFPDSAFDMVASLEALEFLPDDTAALREMIRVLRPDGLLVATRRKGWEARTFIGRYRSADAFEELLRSLGLIHVTTHLWQVDYDLVTAAKPPSLE
jgi:ubiquinone/menaquinone biosynthesis C-methylase UbiE